MTKLDNQCERCGKIFKFPYMLKRHQQSKTKNRCKEITAFGDGERVLVSTDDLIVEPTTEDMPKLDKFSFKNALRNDECYSMILCAIRRSGKTTLIKNELFDLLKSNHDIVIFLSNSIHNSIYDFANCLRFKDYYPGLIDDIMKFQEETKNSLRIALIMDDLVSYSKKNDDSLMQLFVRGRNVNITVVTSSQSTTLVNKNNRGNSDFVIIGNNPSAEFRETIIKSFLLGAVPLPENVRTVNNRMDYLHKFINHFTKDHGFIIMDNINHKVYQFKCDRP